MPEDLEQWRRYINVAKLWAKIECINGAKYEGILSIDIWWNYVVETSEKTVEISPVDCINSGPDMIEYPKLYKLIMDI